MDISCVYVSNQIDSKIVLKNQCIDFSSKSVDNALGIIFKNQIRPMHLSFDVKGSFKANIYWGRIDLEIISQKKVIERFESVLNGNQLFEDSWESFFFPMSKIKSDFNQFQLVFVGEHETRLTIKNIEVF